MTTTHERFPIIHHNDKDDWLPWVLVAPHEAQARHNHDQSLERLAQRGGLSPCEMVAIMEGKDWSEITHKGACRRLRELVVTAAVKAEKERCAKVAEADELPGEPSEEQIEELKTLSWSEIGYGIAYATKRYIADAIRRS